jgi:AP-1 complex subunit gamma-1
LDHTLIASTFRKLVPTVVRLLKNLVLAGYVSEYDVVGITDPFLQCKLIQLLRVLGTGDREASDFMNDILAQVAIGTESTKNPGNAILYETVMTIMSIEAEGGLRVLAVNILGRFLANRDNNIRYVALATLCKCVHKDTAAVQRHRNVIVDNLKDADISIRRRALDLIYALVTKNNVKALVKELLNYLALTSGDVEFKADLTEKICLVVERFAPSKHWHIETIIQVLSTAGNYTRENVATDLILLIARTPNLQAYAVYKLFYALYKKYKHAQLPLMHVVVWCVGEYGDMLISEDGYQQAFKVEGANPADSANNAPGDPTAAAAQAAATPSTTTVISESMVLDLLHKVIKSPLAHNITRQYLLNALIKLTGRFAPGNTPERARLAEYIALYDDSMNMELQQRSCEYSTLVGPALSKIRTGVVGRMPVPTKKTKKELEAAEAAAMSSSGSKAAAAAAGKGGESSGSEESDEEGSSEEDEEEEEETSKKANNGAVPNAGQKAAAPPAAVNLIDMGLFGGDAAAPPVQSPTPAAAAPKPAAALDLMDLFGGGAPAATAQAAPAASNGSFDLFGSLPPTSSPSGGAPAASSSLDLFGAPAPAAASPAAATPGVQTFPSELVFESKGVSVHFAYSRPTATPEVLSVTASFSNSNPFPLTNFDFQVAVLKHVQLAMQPATSTTIPAQSTKQVTQQLTLNNSMHGKKKLLIRVKIDYKANGQPVTETTQIGKFPD